MRLGAKGDFGGVGQAVEPGRLASLVEETGDQAVVLQVVGAFLDELPTRLDRLGAAAQVGSLDEVHDAAHALRSPALMLGAHHLVEACRLLEATRDPRAAQPLAKTVRAEAGLVEASLRTYLASAASSS